jgi:ABC-type transport system involved in multi-copper enzyme maturation permease subunit
MKTIIKREFLDHIQSLQFLILLIVSVLLFAIAGWISIKKYQEEMTNYNDGVNRVRNSLSTTMTFCNRQPNQLTFMADGGLKIEPQSVTLQPKGNILTGPSGETNFKMPDVPELDWAFIIKIVFSLYAILLAFGSISGEKERGTLRMIISNSIGRGQVLLGKFISILLTILVPLTLGFLISLLVAGSFLPNIFTFSTLMRILLMWILSLVYLSIFTFLGLLLSSLIPRSSLVLLALLAVWICFAFIIPNVSGILSDKLAQLPSEQQTAKQMGPMIQKEVWDRIGQIIERAEKGEFQTKEEILAETDHAFEEAQTKVRGYYNAFGNAMQERSRVTRNLSRISPPALFQYAMEGLADSGPKRQERFMEDVRAYSKIYDNYIRSKLGKVVGTSYWSFSTSMVFKGEHVYISSPRPEEYSGDKSDFPYFTENRPSITRNLKEALFDLGGLLFWNLVLAILAFISFLRCDVR